jgi:uncharacterized protein YndB with AHSA1/START domain
MSNIHQEISFKATPAAVYAALTDSKEHAAFTGDVADISAQDGGSWSAYGGKIHGRYIELVPGERIVQAWRPGNWAPGVYSLVRIELRAEDGGTRLVLDHTAVPEEFVGHIDGGWHKMYWDKLQKHLAG